MLHTPAVNVVHNAGEHGMLQCFSVKGKNLAGLRHRCANTSFRVTHSDIHNILDPSMIKALFQTDDKGERQIVKGVDGHIAVVKGKNGEMRIQAFIRDNAVCQPEGLQGDLDQGIAHAYVIVHPPNVPCKSFFLREGHEGMLPHDHISSFSPTDHGIAQVAAAIPLDSASPRVIFDSPNLGSLKGIMLRGEDAHFVKMTFMHLTSKTNGVGMYDIPIKLNEQLSNVLMLSNPSGQVCCAKLRNGIMGYRSRKDGGKSFIFVCNSHDFFDDEPSADVQNSTLQLFKMSYADRSPEGPRISIEITGNEYKKPPCKYNTPLIRLDMTVQDVLNVVEFACRNAMLDHLGCADYPAHWKAHQLLEMHQNGRPPYLDDDGANNGDSSGDEHTNNINNLMMAMMNNNGGRRIR